MIIAGLTGGIATGKSTVSLILKEAGATIIDADKIARDAVKNGLPAWHEIVKHFGRKVLQPDGEINRNYLGDIIFNDPHQKQKLNSIVHPHVFKETANQLRQIEKKTPDAVVILDVPLLIESEMDKSVSEIIVVYAPEHVQLKRLMERDNISRSDAISRIRSQMSVEKKKSLADIVIDNSGTIRETKKRTLEVYGYLRQK